MVTICIHDGDIKYIMILVDVESGKLLKTFDEKTSAVFSEDRKVIIAADNGHEKNIIIYDSYTHRELSSITLSFPDLDERCKFDKYRLFTIERL